MPDKIKKPVLVKELDQHFEPRDALKETPIPIERRFHVAADREPQIKTRLERLDRGDGRPQWEVVVEINGVRAGGRALPPALKGEATKIDKRRISEEELAKHLTGFVPEHLGFNATPRDILKSVKRIRPPESKRRVATTVFGADNRRAFQDTTYPWSTVG